MIKYIPIVLFLFLCTSLNGQDMHFSQYPTSTQFINPARTGIMSNDYRLTLKYRDQWRSVLGDAAYRTYMVSLENKLFCPDGYGSFMAGGLALLADEAGSSGFTTTKAKTTLAYHLKLNGNARGGTMLSGGLQAGAIRYAIRGDALYFEEQFNGMGFDPDLPLSESDQFSDQTPWMLDLALGASLYDLNGKYDLGFSLFHVNQPHYSFKSIGDEVGPRVNMRLTLHGSWLFEFGEYAALRARNLFMAQSPIEGFQHWENLIGVDGQWFFQRFKKEILVGIAFRLAGDQFDGPMVLDALVVGGEIEFEPFILAFSYDINLTSLNTVSYGRGGFELTLQFNFGQNKCVSCPNF